MTNKQVYQYPISPKERYIEMPIGAEILSIQCQYDDVYLWALVDPKKEKEIRSFEIYATGEDILCHRGIKRKYLQTVQMGVLVFHFFERITKKT